MIVPKKLKIKIAERSDTYTGKLGFINYIKAKNIWKFKASYDNWENRSTTLEKEFDNEPTSGFVINSNVGGHSRRGSYYSDYGREMKIRVWDPRGWEIEVTLDNFFNIILPLGVTAGKAMEHEFVYVFNDSSLALMPADSLEVSEAISSAIGESELPNSIESEKFDQSEKTYKIGHLYQLVNDSGDLAYYVYGGKRKRFNHTLSKPGKNLISSNNVFFVWHEGRKGGNIDVNKSFYYDSKMVQNYPEICKNIANYKNSISKKNITRVSKKPLYSEEDLKKYNLDYHSYNAGKYDFNEIFETIVVSDSSKFIGPYGNNYKSIATKLQGILLTFENGTKWLFTDKYNHRSFTYILFESDIKTIIQSLVEKTTYSWERSLELICYEPIFDEYYGKLTIERIGNYDLENIGLDSFPSITSRKLVRFERSDVMTASGEYCDFSTKYNLNLYTNP